MFQMEIVEIIGYVASALIALSMAMRSIVRLRWIGLIGSVCFAGYGLLIHSIPVFLLNSFTAGAHAFYLIQMKHKEEYFEIMRVPNIRTPFLGRFLKFYREEINHFFPEFSLSGLKEPHIIFVFRDMIPAGLFIARPFDKQTLEILLDYVTPGFRDFKSAHYIFYKGKKLFGNKGYQRFITKAYVKEHRTYLKKMDFQPVKINGEQYYERKIFQ